MRSVSLDRLRQLFDMGEGGVLIRRKSVPRVKSGMIAGYDDGKGYLRVRVDYRLFLVHRIVFALANNRWPDKMIDHINGDTKDNRPENLRESNHRLNGANRRTHRAGKLPGAILRGGKWHAGITVGGKKEYLGRFESEATAHEAYLRRASQIEKGQT